METMTIQMLPFFHGDWFPTLTVAKADWEDAKTRATNGEKVVLRGILGGKTFNRHGKTIKLLMTGPKEHGFWDAEDSELGEVVLTDDPSYLWWSPETKPASIYAFEKTGLFVIKQNRHLIPEKDLAEWDAAIREYEAKQQEPGN